MSLFCEYEKRRQAKVSAFMKYLSYVLAHRTELEEELRLSFNRQMSNLLPDTVSIVETYIDIHQCNGVMSFEINGDCVISVHYTYGDKPLIDKFYLGEYRVVFVSDLQPLWDYLQENCNG